MSDNNTSTGRGKTNTTHQSRVPVPHQSTQLYFRPETGELLLVPNNDALDFENHGREMCKAVDDLHRANMGMSDAVAAFQARNATDPTAKANAQKSVSAAEDKLHKANDALREKIKPLGDIKMGGTSIVELIPIRQLKDGPAGNKRQAQYGKKMTYVRSDKIKNHWRTYKLTSKEDTQSGNKSILGKKDGKSKVDYDKLKKQLTAIKPKIKAEFVDFNEHSVSGTLFEFAEAWNKDLKYSHQGLGKFATNNVDISAQAQFMRYMAGVGASAEWSPLEGKAGLKAEAKAEFALAEGKGSLTVYAPNRTGWVMQFTSQKGVSYPLGAIRGQLELAVAGIVGASAVAELGCEIALSPKKIGVRGVPPPPKRLFAMDKDGVEIAGRETVITPAKAELGVFAGAKADADLSGAVQWLNPEDRKKEFKNFIKLAPGVSAMAGAGGSAKFEVSYEGGKFRAIMAASVCIGVGAKGKLGCEADAVLLTEFMAWFFYQLYHANYEHLGFILPDAFEALKNIQFLVIQTGQKAADFLYQTAEETRLRVSQFVVQYENSKLRDQLAARVLTQPPLLRHSTPETKGMLLYQLTRHGKADWVDTGNYEGLDPYGYRKKAAITILTWVQTRAEWANVFQHMTPNGAKTGGDAEGDVRRFLTLGSDEDDQLDTIKNRLKFAPTRGYAVAMNDTPAYSMFTGDSPHYAMVAQLEPLHVGGGSVAGSGSDTMTA
ncbi:MAG TPA: hypothetical protein VGN04_07175 [Herbaspirillum sp.]|jgi:hypothetical protein